MRWFNPLFNVLNTIVLCYTLIIMIWNIDRYSILNNILVYVNIGIFWYNLIQCYIVYMNSIGHVSRKIRCMAYVHYEQATFFTYSLVMCYEHTDILIVHK